MFRFRGRSVAAVTFPMLIFILVLGACGDTPTVTPAVTTSATTTTAAAAVASSSDIPVYPGATVVTIPAGKFNLTSSSGGLDGGAVMAYKSTADLATVKTYYTDTLKGKGWLDLSDAPQVATTTKNIATKLGPDMQVVGAFTTVPDAGGKLSLLYVFSGTPAGSALSGVQDLSDTDRVIMLISGNGG